MPRLAALRTTALREFVRQQRYTPREALVRHVGRVEALAAEIEAGELYPQEWLVYRITGYRPDSPEAELLGGDEVLADCSALAEHLCAAARLHEDELPAGALDVAALCARWSVGRRTIERYRRRGLVARRVLTAGGIARLRFAPGVVEAFEARHGAELARAAAFERVEPRDREAFAGRAADELRRGVALPEVVDAIARSSGRSRGAVRRAIEAAPETRGLVRERAPRTTARTRRVIARALARGVPVARLAERWRRSRASIHRLALEGRVEALQSSVAGTLPAPATPLDEAALADPAAAPAPKPAAILDAADIVAAAREDPPPVAAEERARGAAHRALLVRASRGIAALVGRRVRAAAVEAIEVDLLWALRLRGLLVVYERGLLLRVLEARLGGPLLSCTPAEVRMLHARCFDVAIAATRDFDPSRGGRLAAPVSLALDRALARLDLPRPRSRALLQGAPLDDWTLRLAPWQRLVEPAPRLVAGIAALAPADAEILTLRYGLDGARPRTPAEIATAAGVHPSRVAQARQRAVRRGR